MTEEQIVQEAQRRPAGSARAAFLAEVCGADGSLRQRVESRLAGGNPSSFLFLNEATNSQVHSSAGILTHPLGLDTHTQFPAGGPELVSGRVIGGRYTLEALLGEGGMGEVWIARQEEPVKRRVAIKLIKAGLGSREMLARFEAERQALALMDHPSIARIFDGGILGETPGMQAGAVGQPYFVMEYVEGKSLSQFCDEAKPSLRQRLELFIPICHAVQHAHQKGIIHRDLKPSNILVTRIDGQPVPKIIDFGVAKATAGTPLANSLATQFGTVVGTLEYMAPEQAGFSGLDVDTRADIYSLGVILYELLTGLRPFDAERLKTLHLEELLRLIREEDPPRPSARLAASRDQQRLWELRGGDPKALIAELRGDLDCIAMKCLEKERARRYESANGLARDIQRYLNNETVEATPPNAAHRLRKFLKRHRGPVLAAAGVLIALLAGIVGTTWGLVWALREQGNAVRAADEERRASQLAQRRLLDVEKANDLLASIFQDLDPKAEKQGGPGLHAQLGEQLAAAARLLQPGTDTSPITLANLKHRLGVALRNLGQSEASLTVLEETLRLRQQALGADHPDTLETRYQIAHVHLSTMRDWKKAMPELEEVLARRRVILGPDAPATLLTQGSLSWCCKEAGDFDRALKLATDTLQRQTETLGREHPDTISSQGRLGIIHLVRGDAKAAAKLLEESYRGQVKLRGADHFETMISACNLAIALLEGQEDARAIAIYEDTFARMNAKLGPDHLNTLTCGSSLAEAYRLNGQVGKALPLAEQVCARSLARLGKSHPQVLVFRNNLALLYERVGRLEEAVAIHREVLAADNSLNDLDTAQSQMNLAACLRQLGHYSEAIQLYREAIAVSRRLQGADHPNVRGQEANFALALVQARQGAEAEPLLRELLRVSKAQTPPGFGLFRVQGMLGGALMVQGKYAEAEPLLRSAVAGMQPIARGMGKERLAETLSWLIETCQGLGKQDEAKQWSEELRRLRASMATWPPRPPAR